MIGAVLSALRLVDGPTRRRVWASIPLALLLATLEGGALALLFPVLQSVREPVGGGGGSLSWLADLTGIEDEGRLQLVAVVAVLSLLLAKSTLTMAFRWWQLGFLAHGEERLAVDLFARYLHAPYQFHLGHNSAEAIRNTDSSINAVTRSVLVPATRIVVDGAQLMITTAVVIIADPIVSLTIGGYFGVVAASYVALVGPRTRRLGRQSHLLAGTTLQRMQECLTGAKAIQAAGACDRMLSRFDDERQTLRHVRRRISFVSALPRIYLEISLVVGGVMVALLMTLRSDATSSVATIGLLLAAAFRTLPSVGQILASADSIRAGRAGTDEVTVIRSKLAAAPGPSEENRTTLRLDRSLRAEGLGYTYPDGRVALRDVSFEVRRGDSVGIVGPSGAGKTTLVDLLMGFMSPTVGRLLIDDNPLEEDRIRSWRERVGYIPQEVFLSDDTLRRNVALGLDDEQIDDQQILASLEAASLAELVTRLPDGIDTRLGERGLQLSGGQRQRIGIARALYRSPDVLILDEATSALDNITEHAITNVVNRLASDLTIITIAHRPSTVAGCDRLLRFVDGRLVGDGPVEIVLPARQGAPAIGSR